MAGKSGIKRLLALLSLQIWCGMAGADTLVPAGAFTWVTESVVGLSGLEVSDDGIDFSAIGDRGWFLSGRFERLNKRISGLTVERFLPILGNDGLPVAARRIADWSDAEGLAIASDGTMWIAFEQWTRVARYSSPESPGIWIRDHPSFHQYALNRQLEAVAWRQDGTIYAFPEQPLKEGFPVYRLAEDIWDISGYFPQDDGFAVVGADFAPDDRLYLLERKLVIGLWWQSRVRRLTLSPEGKPKIDEVLWTSKRGEYNNLEGIAVWPSEGGLRLTLVSDSNSDPDEPTQFVEYRLKEESR